MGETAAGLPNANNYVATTGLLPNDDLTLEPWLVPSMTRSEPVDSSTTPDGDGSLRFRQLTAEESESLERLKRSDDVQALSERSMQPSDAVLLRFLMGYEMNIAETAKAIRVAINWKLEHHIDELLWTGPLSEGESHFQDYHAHRWHGLDFEGHPVFFDRIGIANRRAFLNKYHAVDAALRYARALEIGLVMAADVSTMLRRHVDSFLFVFDLAGVKIQDISSFQILSTFKAAVEVMQNVYAGTLYKLLIINAPMAFTTVWHMLKRCVDSSVLSRLEVHGKNWRPRLLELMPERNIPRYLKGSCDKCTIHDCIPLGNSPGS